MPRFDFVSKKDLPTWIENGLKMTLVAGEGYGRTSPLPVYSPLFMIDIEATQKNGFKYKRAIEWRNSVCCYKRSSDGWSGSNKSWSNVNF